MEKEKHLIKIGTFNHYPVWVDMYSILSVSASANPTEQERTLIQFTRKGSNFLFVKEDVDTVINQINTCIGEILAKD